MAFHRTERWGRQRHRRADRRSSERERASQTPYKMKEEQSLQEKYAPRNICFGCGAANPDGLHIRSFATNGEVVAEWKPEKKYEAFEGVLNGGIIGTLLDCHSNWAAAYHLMKTRGEAHPPSCVTAEYAVRLLRPTPTDGPVRLRARVVDAGPDRALVEAELLAGERTTATCRGTFVAVGPQHPPFWGWGWAF